MNRVRCVRFALAAAVLFPALAAQEVRMSNGEVIAGAVKSVEGSRAKIVTSDGKMRVVGVESIDCERLADGTVKRHPAHLVTGVLDAPSQAALARLQKGAVVTHEELLPLTVRCTQEAIDALNVIAVNKGHKSRQAAARILALTATKEGLRAAFDAANGDAGGTLWQAIASAISSGACLGAIEAAGARADVEAMMTSKDRQVRFACAWIAAKLGSPDALPVLATFVGDPDHHARESAATCLAECGNAAGAKVLIGMCTREKSPEMEANKKADAETRDMLLRMTARERIRSCELLGLLKCKLAIPALTALGKNSDPALAEAAKKALAAIHDA